MKVSVIGLGYVGCVTAACLARLGHEVIGYDINSRKISKFNKGETPIEEPQLKELLVEAIKNKNFAASLDANWAVYNSEISFICVRTPSGSDGKMDISAIEEVCDRISDSLSSKKGSKYIIVVRSTIPPGTIDGLKSIFLKKKLIENKDFILASNPEFLREGTAVKDFFEPPYIVIGCDDVQSREKIALLYSKINAEVYMVSVKTAEMIKFINNSWHALEIGFVNEVSSICRKLNMNSMELIKLFSSDTKLNLSDYYLKPNIGYGGSCLPKDLAALKKLGKDLKVDCNILDSISKSNLNQIKRSYKIITEEADNSKSREVGIFGVSFKPGTDDLRGSPIIYVIEKLKSEGYNVKVYDPIVKKEQIENIRNSYKEVIYDPLLSELMEFKNLKDLLDSIESSLSSLDEVIKCKTLVINAKLDEKIFEKLDKGQTIINMRAIIGISNINKIKAKYKEVW
ncbi:nucleotide sugar dehydrogenase [Candidatus Pacearchaeota archaeon]|nr:nucleotide sugar dehydrogenase [Candidatus Pacearchaeota archaeon]